MLPAFRRPTGHHTGDNSNSNTGPGSTHPVTRPAHSHRWSAPPARPPATGPPFRLTCLSSPPRPPPPVWPPAAYRHWVGPAHLQASAPCRPPSCIRSLSRRRRAPPTRRQPPKPPPPMPAVSPCWLVAAGRAPPVRCVSRARPSCSSVRRPPSISSLPCWPVRPGITTVG